jgi:cardiolipin synthase A/B
VPAADAARVSVFGQRVGLAREGESMLSPEDQTLWVTTGYFVPRQAFVDVRCAAVARGVDVRVLVNGPHSHREVARQAGHTSFEELLRCGVRIFEYQRTYLRAKTLVVDDSWASIGTNTVTSTIAPLH